MGSAVGGMGSSTTGSIDDGAGGANPQHTALGLMHLKKLFSEYTHPPHELTEAERDDKLYNMLPLFCKVNIFGSTMKFQNFFGHIFKGTKQNLRYGPK